jgi:hypothetical protein
LRFVWNCLQLVPFYLFSFGWSQKVKSEKQNMPLSLRTSQWIHRPRDSSLTTMNRIRQSRVNLRQRHMVGSKRL